MHRPEDRYEGCENDRWDSKLDPDEKKWEEQKQTAREGDRLMRINRLVKGIVK